MKTYGVVIIILAVVFLCTAPVLAFEDGDWQYWPRITISGRVAAHVVVKLDEEFRVGDSMQDLYFHRSNFGLSYSPKKWLSLNVSYWQSAKESSQNWIPEKRPHFNITVQKLLGGFKVADRNRLERRYSGTSMSVWRYRNQLSLKMPWKWSAYQIRPALATEYYFDFKKNDWNKQRLFVILDSRLSQHVGINWYYLAEFNLKSDAWLRSNIFGTKLNLSF